LQRGKKKEERSTTKNLLEKRKGDFEREGNNRKASFKSLDRINQEVVGGEEKKRETLVLLD